MSVSSLFLMRSLSPIFIVSLLFLQLPVSAFTGSEYYLDTEYKGSNFFDGWDFFTGRDPTNGFVTYYSRSSAQLKGLINASDTTAAYMGVDYSNQLPVSPSTGQADGAGRPSVRIKSKRSWTHGLFIGDFSHAPTNICGTWPAFWTLGPNWPYTGEIDIMEGVNKVVSNGMALHTNTTCTINGNSITQLGVQGNKDCAAYPNDNTGCGVLDSRPASYSNFNNVGGGVFAMQWTSEYIRIWFFARSRVPQDIIDGNPKPYLWGLPAADMQGGCKIDQHFQQHKIVFDTTFCGDYAGNKYVWDSSTNSCAADTRYATCDAFVAKTPAAFKDAYWSINYVRVYQLADPKSTTPGPQYIASLQPASNTNQVPSSPIPAPSPMASLCPTYNFTTVQNGGLTYEIECTYDLPGDDLPPPYSGYKTPTFEACVAGCTYYNTVNGTNTCGGVSYDISGAFCYYKKYINDSPKYRAGFAGARLIYYGYPQIADDPRSQVVTSTSTFVETMPVPQTYRPSVTTSTIQNTYTSFNTTSVSIPTIAPPPLGTPTDTTTLPTVDAGIPTVSYSGTGSIPVTNVTLIGSSTETTPAVTSKPATDASTTTLQPINTRTFDLPGPATIAAFTYAGCSAPRTNGNKFTLKESYAKMTIQRCIRQCGDSYYAGVHQTECYCIDSPITDGDLVQYSNSACNSPCPGNPSQKCGGTVSLNETTTISKRQIVQGSNLLLLTLYANTARTVTVTAALTDTATITITPTSILTSTTTSNLVASQSVPGSFSYNITGTNTITVTAVSTTWCDYCSTCAGYETTLNTTIMIPCPVTHTGALVRPPAIPMMTVTRLCECGIDGSASHTTVTVPCETEIAILTKAAQQILAVQNQSAVAVAAASFSVLSTAGEHQYSAANTQTGPAISPHVLVDINPTSGSQKFVDFPVITVSLKPVALVNATVIQPSLSPVETYKSIQANAFTGDTRGREAGKAVLMYTLVFITVFAVVILC